MTAERLPALGQPDNDELPDRDPDFSNEHDATAVDKNVTSGRDTGETESPNGWSGLDRDITP